MASHNKVKRVTKVNRLHPRSRRFSAAGPRQGGPVPVEPGMHAIIIHIREGEDIKRKIFSFTRGQWAFAILSGHGSVSAAKLKIPGSGETVTYERPFELVNLRGSYTNGESGPTGGVTVSLVDADGTVRHGAVEGVLTAGGPVQVVIMPTLVAW